MINFSNYSNLKNSKFKSNFLDDQDFSNFMKGLDKGDWTKGFTVFNIFIFLNKLFILKIFTLIYYI